MKAIRTANTYKKVATPRNTRAQDTTRFAVSTDDARETLQHVHHENGWKVAADGYRLHIAPIARGEHDHCEVCEREGYEFLRFNEIIPTQHTFEFSTNAGWLRAAAVRAGLFSNDNGHCGAVIIDASLESLTVTGWSEELGVSVNDVAILYSEGTPLRFGVNFRYLIDALDHCAPEGGVVVIKLNAATHPIKIEGKDERAAVVMPIKVDDCNPHLLGSYVDDVHAPAYSESGKYSPAYDWDTKAQTNPEPYYQIADLTTGPAEGAQDCSLAIVKTNDVSDCDDRRAVVLVVLEVTPQAPVKIEASAPAPRGDKSSRMTWLNIERAKIRRLYRYDPAALALELEYLYATFGNLQRKDYKPPAPGTPQWRVTNHWHNFTLSLDVTSEFNAIDNVESVTNGTGKATY